jgi:hypothetical protein
MSDCFERDFKIMITSSTSKNIDFFIIQFYEVLEVLADRAVGLIEQDLHMKGIKKLN